MARRSKSKNNSKNNLAVYIILAAAVIAALILGKFILNKRAQHFSDLSELSIIEIKNNANSLSGNKYRVSGEITEKLKWTTNNGQIISLSVDQGGRNKGTIPIIIPAGINQVNLERGHNYTFKVEIDRKGLPIALDVKAQ